MIPRVFVEEVQEKTDIVELISAYIPLKRAGRNFKALCPFHAEKTSSFIVSPQKQIFHCFGCGEGGGVLQFLMRYEKVNFVEAIEMLAQRAGMSVPHQQVSPSQRLKPVLYEVLEEAVQFYHRCLFSPQGKEALQYLARRSIDRSIVEKFQIGYAAQGTNLLPFLRKKGYSLELLEKASLVTADRSGGYNELFRGRILFPIYDIRRRPLGFGARILAEREGTPKYINSLENTVYSKRSHLFGLHLAKEHIIKNDMIIVTEGYLDMIMPFSKGITNVVASLGTALTSEQIRLMKRFTNNVILFYDADKAGQSATVRAVDLLLEHDLNVKVARVPKGFDLDLAIRQMGPSAVNNMISEAMDFFDYKIFLLEKVYDRRSIEGKIQIGNQMLTTFLKLSSEIERYECIKRLSSFLDVKEPVLAAEMQRLKKETSVNKEFVPLVKEKIPMAEKVVLKFLFTHPKVLGIVKKNLEETDFTHALSRKSFNLALKGFSSAQSFSVKSFLSSVEDTDITKFISSIMMEEIPYLEKEVFRDCIMKLRENRARALADQLKEEIKRAEQNNDFERVKELLIKFDKIKSEVFNGQTKDS